MKSFEQLKMEVKDQADFVEIASRYTQLKKSARGHTGLCPFPGHKEKTPSFHVAEDHCWCFGCNRGGDVFSFLELVEGMSFKEALRELSIELGLGWDWKSDAESVQQSQEYSQGLELLDRAVKYYSNHLWDASSHEAQMCRDYLLKDRGLQEVEIRALRLGYAPVSGLTAKISQATDRQRALAVGLLKKLEDGRVVDFFRNRLMIPISDSKGKVLGFSGRVLPHSDHPLPKYMNSPETDWFKKKRIVYGLDRVLSLIRDSGFVVLVEGFFDQWAFERKGIPAVAVMGTALSEDHLSRLERYTKQMVMVLDADAAGIAAMRKNLPILLDRGWDLKVFDGLGGKDPDEWLSAQRLEREQIADRLLHASDAVEWLTRQLILESGQKSWNRSQLLESIQTQVWPLVRSELQRTLVVDVLMPSMSGLPRDEIRRALGQTPSATPKAPHRAGWSAPRSQTLSPEDTRTKDLLCWLFWNWDALRPWDEKELQQTRLDLKATRAGAFAERVLVMERAELPWDQARAGIAEAAEGLSDPILKSWILMGLVAPQLVDAQDLVRVRPTFVQLRSALRRSILEAEATRLAASISAQSGDPDATARLLQRIQEIQRDLRQIKLGLENPN